MGNGAAPSMNDGTVSVFACMSSKGEDVQLSANRREKLGRYPAGLQGIDIAFTESALLWNRETVELRCSINRVDSAPELSRSRYVENEMHAWILARCYSRSRAEFGIGI